MDHTKINNVARSLTSVVKSSLKDDDVQDGLQLLKNVQSKYSDDINKDEQFINNNRPNSLAED